MSDNNLPSGFTPISPDSDFGKMMEKFKGFDTSYSYNLASQIQDDMEQQRNDALESVQKAYEDKEAYQNEMLRTLHAIESNTANLYTLVELISKSNEQQDELIEIIAEILSIAKAKSKKESEVTFTKVMSKITQTVKDAETIVKLTGYATAVYQMAQPVIENLMNK